MGQRSRQRSGEGLVVDVPRVIEAGGRPAANQDSNHQLKRMSRYDGGSGIFDRQFIKRNQPQWCAARVAEGAPPRHRQRKCSAAAVVARADPTSQVTQVQPTCVQSRRKTCRGSQTFNPHHSTLFQVFVKLPCPCQVRCLGNPERDFMKELINTHTVILQK